MNDLKKTKIQLIRELKQPHRPVGRLKKSEKELERAESFLAGERFKLKEYFDNLPFMAYNISLDGKIMDVNRVTVKKLGYRSKGELIGRPLINTVYTPAS